MILSGMGSSDVITVAMPKMWSHLQVGLEHDVLELRVRSQEPSHGGI